MRGNNDGLFLIKCFFSCVSCLGLDATTVVIAMPTEGIGTTGTNGGINVTNGVRAEAKPMPTPFPSGAVVAKMDKRSFITLVP